MGWGPRERAAYALGIACSVQAIREAHTTGEGVGAAAVHAKRNAKEDGCDEGRQSAAILEAYARGWRAALDEAERRVQAEGANTSKGDA